MTKISRQTAPYKSRDDRRKAGREGRGSVMRKVTWGLPGLIILLLFPFIATRAGAEDLKSQALSKLQKSVVKALPVKGNTIRLAVLDFDGDDGSVKNAIISAITDKMSFKVMERADLDKILSEQGLQLKDIVDEKTRIQHGKIKGVQGLLMGRVIGMEKGFLAYQVEVHVKLDDVEKGQVIFARDFSESVVSPIRTWLLVGSVAVLVLIVVLILFAGGKRAVNVRKINQDAAERIDIAKEAGRAAALLSEAKAKLMDKGRPELAVAVKEIEREIRLLRDLLDGIAQGNPTSRKGNELKYIVDFDKGLVDAFQGLTVKAQKFYEGVLDGNDNLQKQVELLKAEVVSAANVLRARKI